MDALQLDPGFLSQYGVERRHRIVHQMIPLRAGKNANLSAREIELDIVLSSPRHISSPAGI
jgi:hypothetical protein